MQIRFFSKLKIKITQNFANSFRGVRDVRGQGTLMFVTMVCAIGTIFIFTSASTFKKDYDQKTRDFDQVLLNEVATSAFAVMESALSRRLWEPPPDNNCLKAKDFSVNGGLPNGALWTVVAKYNSLTKNFEMTSVGKHKGLTATYIKRVKVLDVSDYLLYSENAGGVVLSRTYNEKLPVSLIARDRRVYIKGPLSFTSWIDRPNPKLDWNGSPARWPGEFGTLVQGDRLQFTGGIFTNKTSPEEPNPTSSNIVNLLKPYSNEWGTPPRFYGQTGGGYAVISRDYNKVKQLNDQILSGASGPLSLASIRNSVYPTALFSGTPPLESWRAVDTGTYFNDPDRDSIFTYNYAKDNNFGLRINATCLSKADAHSPSCSNSEQFPKGFASWRKNADLEGVLFTSDSEVIPSPSLSWDNFEALEEDAKKCGLLVEAPNNQAYEDCPVWDLNFMTNYALTGKAVCQNITSLDMDTIHLNNFNPSVLSDPANKDLIQRRIIYLKVPAEVKQASAVGLMSQITDNAIRKNLPLWIVSEDLIAFRGYQKDTTSPLDSDPGRLREVVFNDDANSNVPGAKHEPLPLAILSSEKVHLLSPFYKPASSSYLHSYYPSSGGKIHPVFQNTADYVRNENDGFRYGYRTYRLGNMSLISSTANDPSAPFYMRGLWSGPDSSAEQISANQCLVSKAGTPLQQRPGVPFAVSALIPAYAGSALSPIPPVSSAYYHGQSYFPNYYYPQIFWEQIGHGNSSRQESTLLFSGTRIYTKFAGATPEGKRDLSKPLYSGTESRWHTIPNDSSHKNFAWDIDYYYKNKALSTACLNTNLEYRSIGTETHATYGTVPSYNNGRYSLIHSEPPLDYRGIGAIVGVSQPILETKVRSEE